MSDKAVQLALEIIAKDDPEQAGLLAHMLAEKAERRRFGSVIRAPLAILLCCTAATILALFAVQEFAPVAAWDVLKYPLAIPLIATGAWYAFTSN